MIPLRYIFVICILIILVVVGAYLTFQYGFTTILNYVKSVIGVNYSRIYNLYGYQYVQQVRSLGPVIETIDNVESSLICANYAAATNNCVGGNYIAATSTCELVSSILPLSDNPDYETFVMSATNLKNKVSAFTATEGQRQKGVLFESTALNYKPYMAALCASIPTCSGYCTNFSAANNTPSGCLLTDSAQQSTRMIDVNSILYTGVRTDGVLYNQADNTTGPYYRWSTTVGSNSALLTTQYVTTLDECGAIAQETISAVGAVWDPSTNGTCTVYSSLNSVVSDPVKTLLTWKANPSYLNYSNTFTTVTGVDYPTASVFVTGFENANIYTLEDAKLALINANGACNCIILDTTTNFFTFKNVTSTDASSTVASTTIAYVVPTTFY